MKNGELQDKLMTAESYNALSAQLGSNKSLSSKATSATLHQELQTNAAAVDTRWFYQNNQLPSSSYCWHSHPNRVEQAFKVVQALVKSKRLKLQTVDAFMAVMDEIQKAL